jgi:hypothetical protein
VSGRPGQSARVVGRFLPVSDVSYGRRKYSRQLAIFRSTAT